MASEGFLGDLLPDVLVGPEEDCQEMAEMFDLASQDPSAYRQVADGSALSSLTLWVMTVDDPAGSQNAQSSVVRVADIAREP